MTVSFFGPEDFAAHVTDIFSDIPVYLKEAAKDAPCVKCVGTGTTQMPTDQEAIKREVIFGLFVHFGAHTSHTFPGDPCTWCEGSGINTEKQQVIAAERFAKDWYPVMCELFWPKEGVSP